MTRLPARVAAALGGLAALAIGRDLGALRRDRAVVGARRLRANGLDTFARVAGPPDAPPVVLVHGLVISSVYMIPLAARLAADYRVHAPDLPGFGRSERPAAVLDVEGLADALLAWLDAAGIARAHFVANSLGCQVVSALAVRRPERVDRLVLLGPTVDAGARTIARQSLRILRCIPHERPSILVVHARDWLRFGLARAYHLARHAVADRPEERLPRVAAPTLVVRGGSDRIAQGAWCARVAALIPGARYVELAGAGHALNYSAADETARLVRDFLR